MRKRQKAYGLSAPASTRNGAKLFKPNAWGNSVDRTSHALLRNLGVLRLASCCRTRKPARRGCIQFKRRTELGDRAEVGANHLCSPTHFLFSFSVSEINRRMGERSDLISC